VVVFSYINCLIYYDSLLLYNHCKAAYNKLRHDFDTKKFGREERDATCNDPMRWWI